MGKTAIELEIDKEIQKAQEKEGKKNGTKTEKKSQSVEIQKAFMPKRIGETLIKVVRDRETGKLAIIAGRHLIVNKRFKNELSARWWLFTHPITASVAMIFIDKLETRKQK